VTVDKSVWYACTRANTSIIAAYGMAHNLQKTALLRITLSNGVTRS